MSRALLMKIKERSAPLRLQSPNQFLKLMYRKCTSSCADGVHSAATRMLPAS